MDQQDKITRFEQLVELDPDDATSHFTLGGAYAEAGRHEDAAEAYLTAVSLDGQFSKAYQLAGQSLIQVDQNDKAADVLKKGHEVAAAQGDMLPKQAIEALLKNIGAELPEAAAAADEQEQAPAPEGSFICQKTDRPGTPMARPPFRGPLGEWLQERIASETWQTWLSQGTKIINELRLDLSSEQGSDIWDFGMLLYFNINEPTYRELTGKEPPVVQGDYKEALARILNADPDTLASFKGALGENVSG